MESIDGSLLGSQWKVHGTDDRGYPWYTEARGADEATPRMEQRSWRSVKRRRFPPKNSVVGER